MKFKTFAQMEEAVRNSGIQKRIVLANAHDVHSLPAVADAKHKGIVQATLIGHADKIREILANEGESCADYEIINCHDDIECARLAIALVREGKADLPMKGLMQTSDIMRTILNKETGLLPKGGLISQITVMEKEDGSGFLFVTDCAINIAPDLETKKKIVKNAVRLAHQLGYEEPKVAALSALEVPNPKIPSTMDGRALQEACESGELTGCKVGGPLALDNAVSPEAASHKSVDGPVRGDADILLVPDLACGNILTKSLIFFAKATCCGVVTGTTSPVIMTSRTDTPENKYRGIVIALFTALCEQL